MKLLKYEEKIGKLKAREVRKARVKVEEASPTLPEGDPYHWVEIQKARWLAAEDKRVRKARVADPWALRRNPPDMFSGERHPVGNAMAYARYLAYRGPIEKTPATACGCDNCRYEWILDKLGIANEDIGVGQYKCAMAALQVKAETGKWPWES